MINLIEYVNTNPESFPEIVSFYSTTEVQQQPWFQACLSKFNLPEILHIGSLPSISLRLKNYVTNIRLARSSLQDPI
jgi:hypothetical protein